MLRNFPGFKPKECAMKSLITRAVLIASLALTADAAMAANPSNARTVSHPRPAAQIVLRPRNPLNADIGQFIQSMLGGGPVQYSRLTQDAMRARPSHRSAGSADWSPSYDSSPAIDSSSSNTDSQAASDAANQAIQSMNDENALNGSVAAAEAQNEAAQAAAIQTEINANN
jgi:hypothetical protein